MLRNEDIRIGTVVSHRQLGPGQIVDVDDDQVMVDFVSEPGNASSMSRNDAKESLRRLQDEGLEARLILAPEETQRWAEESPLRLVAAALTDNSARRASAKDLREKLEVKVIKPERWTSWWKKVQNALKESPQFSYNSDSSPQMYRLRAKPEEVEAVSWGDLRSSARPKAGKTNAAVRLADWVTWMQADEAGPMPAGTSGPPDALIPVIENMPAAITPKAVERLAGAIEERVVSAKRPPKSTPLFSDSLVAGLYRWSELHRAPDMPVAEITTLAARLLEVSDEGEHDCIVNWLADYASKSSDNVGIVVNAMLFASRKVPDGTQRLLTRVHNSLDRPTRIAFWHVTKLLEYFVFAGGLRATIG